MWWRISDPAVVTAPPRQARPARRQALAVGLPVTALAYLAGSLAATARLAPLAVAIGCLALATAAALTALLTARSALLAGYRSACGVLLAAWLGFAASCAAWSPAPAAVLAVLAAAAIGAYPRIRAREDLAAERARQAELDAAAAQQQRKWPDLLARIGHPGIRFAGREPTMAGYLVHLRLPGSGKVTYSALAPSTERLEVAARLRHGSLRFERGTHAHEVILHVAERDVLAETVPFPDELGPLSISTPIPIGLYEDGRTCAVTLQEVATLIVGLRGSGKSNLLNVLMAQLARCPDVLIFAIDLKGGRMAAPWIEPWLANRTAAPLVDWLATDREETERMLKALLRAVDARSRSGSGGEKIRPSFRQPAILVICDEIAVILGMGTGGPRTSQNGMSNVGLASLATRLVMTGRSEAIDLIMATQRGTVTMLGSADLKSQCAVRIGLGVASEGDARLIIPDDARIAADLTRLRHPGTGIVQEGKNGRVLPVKFYRIEHDAIATIAERYGRIRPAPDPLLEEALGEEYRERWSPERTAKVPGAASRPQVEAAPARQAVAAYPVPPALPAGAAPASGPEPDPELEPGGADPGPLPHGPAGERFAELAASAALDAEHPARQRLAALLKSAGVRGMTVRGICDQLSATGQDVAQQTIHRWLTEEAAAGRVERATYGRWKWQGG
jgi:hypothetical protein